ncbi:hypothetical protein Nepgr_005869 [Nepenthes gracilis]|uniref:Uncharacterized protein n=1 Tax=Nepenthes gracilis TaxID=150966 RepID=A0AAD3S3Z5_NEPGR|nr:hypothetical protein Nepgr_005869 [Nepenthes gracilis]
MDTASMLDEAVHYVKFLKSQLQSLKRAAVDRSLVAAAVGDGTGVGNPATMTRGNCIPVMKGYLHHHPGVQNVHQQQQ